MPTTNTSLNKAHQHASIAEDYVNQGLLIPAAEEHYKSAEAFLLCVEQAGDEGTKRTLRMLYNEHSKSGKELQRKIAKLKEEGKDPSLPQVSRTPPPLGRGYALSSTAASTSSSSHPNARGRLAESNPTIDESYMVLEQQSDHTFNEFWKVFEGMLDNLSQPVAFATAPLASPPPTSDSFPYNKALPRGTDANYDESIFQAGFVSKHDSGSPDLRRSGQEGQRTHGAQGPHQTQKNMVHVMSEADSSDSEEVLADPDSPSGESFFLIPSSSEPSVTQLRKENVSLKSEVEHLQRRLDLAERKRLEQEQQIRDGISQARREAQRVMTSTFLPQRPLQPPDLIALNLKKCPPVATPIPTVGNGDREAQLMRRNKELEEEIQSVRAENEKQKAMIAKFRERWEKLKESAKRKRNAKANTGLESVREQRIEEEPEAEAEVEAETQVSPSH